ncbi:MAG: transporter substrate-binding domain-containing protein, partial [Patescibacteria group bacterium]
DLSLADFNAKQISITDGYLVMDYVINNYPRIIIEPVSDDEVGLQKVLLGEVDAAVMDLASLSYYTSRDMLSYVTVAGQTGFEYKLAFAVPKSMPDLQDILNSGLKEITPSERAIIKDRWVTFPFDKEAKKGLAAVFFIGKPLWIGVSILGSILLAALLTIIIIHNRKYHRLSISSLRRTHDKKDKIDELTDELKDLEDASTTLSEDMQEIKSLEKAIKEKIEHINN